MSYAVRWRRPAEWSRYAPRAGEPARDLLVVERETGKIKVWLAWPLVPLEPWHAAWAEQVKPPAWFSPVSEHADHSAAWPGGRDREMK